MQLLAVSLSVRTRFFCLEVFLYLSIFSLSPTDTRTNSLDCSLAALIVV